MADISKCNGFECSIRNECYRYTAKENDLCQSWSTYKPNKDGTCDNILSKSHYNSK